MTYRADMTPAEKAAAMEACAEKEARIYGQTALPAMLRDGAAAVLRVAELEEARKRDDEHRRAQDRRIRMQREELRYMHVICKGVHMAAAQAAGWNKKRAEEAEAKLAAAQQREAGLLEALQDPLVVHLNMLAGKIAKPLPSQLVHIYGEEVIAALAEVQADARREGEQLRTLAAELAEARSVPENILEALRLKVAMWEDDEDLADWVAPGKTLIAEAAALTKGPTP